MDTKTDNKNTPNLISVLIVLTILVMYTYPMVRYGIFILGCILKNWFSVDLFYFLIFTHTLSFIAFILSFLCNTNTKKKLIILLLSILSLAMIFIISNFQNYYYSKFTATKWQNHIEARYHMFDDFIEKNNIIGKQITDIEQLLGKADNERIDENYKKVYKSSGKCNGIKEIYSMGCSESLLLHGTLDYLIIHYNKENIVIGYEACHVSY